MSLLKPFATVSFYTLVSRIAGFVRDMTMASILGAGPLSEAFLVAFRMPNFFRSLFAEGTFNSAFVPMFSGTLSSEGREAALLFAERVMALMVMILSIFTVVMIAGMDWLMLLMAPGFVPDKEKFELTVYLSRITFPYLGLISLVALMGGVLNSIGKFAAVAAAPIVLNLTLIAALFVGPAYAPTPAHSQAVAVTIAGVLQLMWMIFACKRAGVGLRLRRPHLTPDVKLMLKRMVPGIVGAGVVQINLWVDTFIATMIPGAVAYLYYADRIYQLPLSIVGTAIGTALLPVLSRHVREGKVAEAAESQNRALEMAMFCTIPATFALFIAAEPIVRTLYEHGAFGAQESIKTAAALMAGAVGLPAFVMIKIFVTSYFSCGDTKTPVRIGIICMIANVVFNVIFIFLFKRIGVMPHVGITLATAMSAWLNVTLLVRGLLKREGFVPDARLKKRVSKMFICGALMAAGVWLLMQLLAEPFAGSKAEQAFAMIVMVGVSMLIYLISIHFTGALRLSEVKAALRRKK